MSNTLINLSRPEGFGRELAQRIDDEQRCLSCGHRMARQFGIGLCGRCFRRGKVNHHRAIETQERVSVWVA